jgi:hypothetical protein
VITPHILSTFTPRHLIQIAQQRQLNANFASELFLSYLPGINFFHFHFTNTVKSGLDCRGTIYHLIPILTTVLVIFKTFSSLEMASSSELKVMGNRLKGKVAIVTGGGSGFGEAIATRFAEEGSKVVIADMDPVGGQRVAGIHPHTMMFIKMNVANEEDWERVLEITLSKWGRVDICVNNAGTSYKNKASNA